MRKPSFAALVLIGLAAPLAAQSRQAPNLVFTISGGLTLGGDFWQVSPQPYPVPPNAADSFTLGRIRRPGLVATLGASLFRSPHLGYWAEVGYFGIATESRCRPLGPYAPDPDNTTQQACDGIQGAHVPSSTVGFQLGLVYRIAPARFVSPYLRAGAGLATLGASFVQTAAVVGSQQCAPNSTCQVALLTDRNRRDVSGMATAAAGFTLSTGPAYKVRIEARDLVAWLPNVEGPAPPGALQAPPVGTKVRHVLVFTAGVDIVLVRRRGRRY